MATTTHSLPDSRALMSANTAVLRFAYPSPSYYSDIRTFRVEEVGRTGAANLELYRFSHPSNGMAIGLTLFERKKSSSDEWEQVGDIEWTSPLTGTVQLSGEELPIEGLRRIKNGSSTSRRFRYNGKEYKWKINDNKEDLYCIDSANFVIAKWNQQQQILWLHTRRSTLVELLLVTCLLNLWFRTKHAW